MRDDFKLVGQTVSMEFQLEQRVADRLAAMESHMKITRSELMNTAMKRFISQHKDFFPPGYEDTTLPPPSVAHAKPKDQ